MKKTVVFVYGILVFLTICSALVSNLGGLSSRAIVLIMGLSVLKFYLVSFEFMELKKANFFWKITLISVVLVLVFSVCFIKMSA
jgi:hypothetical protein